MSVRGLRGLGALGAALVVVVVGALLIAPASGVGSAASRPQRAVAPDGHQLAPATPVDFDLVLRLRERALAHYADGLFAASSPLYGHYLSPAQFGRRFGVGTTAVARLSMRLGRLGLEAVRSYPQETALRVRATAAVVRRVFGVTLRGYVDPSGERYRAPSGAPVVPAALAPWVSAVSGLDTRSYATLDSLPFAALRPVDLATGYDISPLYGGSGEGKGETIAVLSIGHVSLSDYAYFSSQVGLPAGPTPLVRVLSTPDKKDTTEGDLDLETVHAVAPQAQIVDYETSWSSLPAAINTIADNNAISIVSASFSACDGYTPNQGDELPAGFRRDVESALMAAALKGDSFFFATGDSGAYACEQATPSDTTLSVGFPSDAPYAVAVGGTVLSLNGAGAYQSETGWQDDASNQGGGGGLNPFDAAPPWQSAVRVPGISNGKRQTPDVSAAAGAASPTLVYDRGDGGFESVWGTSAATPFWAASMLLVAQRIEQEGAGPLCFAAPLLYAIAERSWVDPPFHDVTVGGNRYYNAGAGWDFATGWGSPNVNNLATAIVSYRLSHPLPSTANACAAAVP
jgi:kumamolisin